MTKRQENMVWGLAFANIFMTIAVPRRYTPAAVLAGLAVGYALYWHLKREPKS